MNENKSVSKPFHTPEELLEICKEEGIELTDEELSSISGGISWGNKKNDNNGIGINCPFCGSSDVRIMIWRDDCDSCIYTCYSCNTSWMGEHID